MEGRRGVSTRALSLLNGESNAARRRVYFKAIFLEHTYIQGMKS
jgi:hypothetical protein